MFVLDTNVVSELMLPHPDSGVSRWVASQPSSLLFTTTITEAEIAYGVGLLPAGRRRRDLEAAVVAMFGEDFAGRVLSFDSPAAQCFGAVTVERRKLGLPISHADAQIAAIARARGATLATRNTADFNATGIVVVDPWVARV